MAVVASSSIVSTDLTVDMVLSVSEEQSSAPPAPSCFSASSAAGLSFYPIWRSHTAMDESLEHIIRQALEEAQAKGRDHLTQTTLAVRAVCQACPELTAPEAAAEVRRVQRTMRSLLASVFFLFPPAAFDGDMLGTTGRQIEGGTSAAVNPVRLLQQS
jgi:hypothetical protein